MRNRTVAIRQVFGIDGKKYEVIRFPDAGENDDQEAMRVKQFAWMYVLRLGSYQKLPLNEDRHPHVWSKITGAMDAYINLLDYREAAQK